MSSDPFAGAATDSLRIHTFASLNPGPRLLVMGGVHGDETCGTVGIERVLAELDSGALRLLRRQKDRKTSGRLLRRRSPVCKDATCFIAARHAYRACLTRPTGLACRAVQARSTKDRYPETSIRNMP